GEQGGGRPAPHLRERLPGTEGLSTEQLLQHAREGRRWQRLLPAPVGDPECSGFPLRVLLAAGAGRGRPDAGGGPIYLPATLAVRNSSTSGGSDHDRHLRRQHRQSYRWCRFGKKLPPTA
ncbi:unnamed protein product, partial [Ectocarpus sp. 12 AP-2014]